MSDFSTEASLSIQVEQQELRRVRREVENALSDVSLGFDAPNGRGRVGANGNGDDGRERRRRRREFRWARQRTGDLEEAVELLDDISDNTEQMGDGDGILGGLIGGVGGVIPTALGAGIGAAVGSTVGDAISSETVQLDTEDLEAVTLSVDDPSPLSVDDPSPLGVEEPTLSVEIPTLGVEDVGPLAVEDVPPLLVDDPSPLRVEDVPPLLVDDPSPLRVEDVPDILVERPDWKVGVEQPEPIRVDVTGRGVGAAPDGRRDERQPGIGRRIGEAFRGGVEQIPVVGEDIAEAERGATRRIFEIAGLEPPEDVRRGESTQRAGRDDSTTEVTTVQVQQTTRVEPDITIEADLDRVVDDTVAAFEREIETVASQLSRDIEQLERRVERELR